MTSFEIPLSDLDIGDEERVAALRVLDSRWLTMGAEVAAFESEFAALCDADGAVAVSSGTAALHLACAGLGLGPGDEVLVPAMTFVASANAIAHTGATPVFVDCRGPADMNLDPDDCAMRITARTRAIMCVHYGGFACDLDRLRELCDEHGLILIEDVAHAPGGRHGNAALGTWGDAGAFSFFGNKNMTSGEGGMVLARDPEVLARVRLLRSHGMTTTSWDRFRGHASEYDVVALGFNYRPTELTAAIGRAQLEKLPANNERRMRRLSQYHERLGALEGISVPFAGRIGTGHLCVVLVDDPAQRDALRETLATVGVQSSVHYPPAHLFAHYVDAYAHAPGDLPRTEDAAARTVTLPLYSTMRPEQVDTVCDAVVRFLTAP